MKSYLLMIVIVFFLLVARSPEKVFQPQLWAEDGTVFFTDAYELPFWSNLTKPNLGYLQVFQRLLAGVTVGFRMYKWTPFVWNFTVLAIASALIAIFQTRLYETLLPNQYLRAVFTCLVAAGGSFPEILGNLTNVHSYFALLGLHMMVYFYFWPKHIFAKTTTVFLVMLIFLIVVSSPYSFVFVPFFLVIFLVKKNAPNQRWLLGFFLFGVFLQVLNYLFTTQMWNHQTPIFASNIIALAEAHDPQAIQAIQPTTIWQVIEKRALIQNFIPYPFANFMLLHHISWLLGLVALSMCGVYWFYSKHRQFINILGLLVLANIGVLLFARPTVFLNIASTTGFETFFAGRYFFISYVIFLLIACSVLNDCMRTYRGKWEVGSIFFLQILASLFFFKNPILLNDFHWDREALQISQLHKNQTLHLPINPTGWQMELVR